MYNQWLKWAEGGGGGSTPASTWLEPRLLNAGPLLFSSIKSRKVRLHGESDALNHKDAEYLQAAVSVM